MYYRKPRMLSQASYALIQSIHRENERQHQAERGLRYRAFARAPAGLPLHIGPEIDGEIVRPNRNTAEPEEICA